MQCPACGSHDSEVVQSICAKRRSDGRTYRNRRCHTCGSSYTTYEVHRFALDADKAAREADSRTAAPPPKVAIPTANPTPQLYDLEDELEKGLPAAVECIIDAVRPGTSPDKVKIDAAKWLVDDRRKWRIQMAEQANRSGEVPSDPAMAQLANILRLVPDQEAIES